MTLCYSDMKHYCSLVLVLSVYAYDVHCYSTSGNLREILIDCFQKTLMNDNEQLFTLQKAFLLPQQIAFGGKYLTIGVTVQVRIDLTSNPEYSYYCDEHLNESNSCIYNYNTTRDFELSPAPATTSTLLDFLQSNFIMQALEAMDPSFLTLITVISNDFISDYHYDSYNYFDLSPYNSYGIHMTCTVGNIDPSQMYNDVTDAVYVTLSWVSYNNMIIIHDNILLL